MRSLTCPQCDHLVVFESLTCLNCGTLLAFDFDARSLVRLEPGEACSNRELLQCNGRAAGGGWCTACALTRRRSEAPTVLANLAKTENAKRRLLFTLLELGLPVRSWRDGPGGLGFDFLDSADAPVVTGQAEGIITLDLAEADDAHRAHVRIQLDEAYRTLLGHLRHETGHYFEELLAPQGSPARERYRALFGDEQADYQAAINAHYANGAPPGWEADHVSAYATMHPFEDWAETFAHYLHLRDTLQTAQSWGVNVVGPTTADVLPLHSFPALADATDLPELLEAWIPLTYAMNALNRSMGARDLYPFVLTEPVIAKLGLVHELVGSAEA